MIQKLEIIEFMGKRRLPDNLELMQKINLLVEEVNRLIDCEHLDIIEKERTISNPLFMTKVMIKICKNCNKVL